MSKAVFTLIKNDDRLFFNDGEKCVLLDTGFIRDPLGKSNSVSADGKIGPFSVDTMPKEFFKDFINLEMSDGESVTAVFNPMDGYNCILEGETIAITDEETEVVETDHFFNFLEENFSILEGKINGVPCRMLFDSGARMTMFGERALVGEKVRSYCEWMAMIRKHEELEVFNLELEFPDGFKYHGEGALVENPLYRSQGAMLGIKAMLGIDIFNTFDMVITAKGSSKGIGLKKKS